jgi:DNA-binding NtrC family response regulator
MLTKELASLKEHINKRFTMSSIVRESEAMAAVVEMLQKLSTYDKPILMRGEPGTGKDLAAWAVHHSGKRKEKPMVVFDCSAYPPNLIEEELFGNTHERGPRNLGKIKEASKGTLYLDKIEKLALPAQEKILALVDKTFADGHGAPVVASNIHLIASTTTNLSELSRTGKFNRHLHDLLHQYEVTLPPLRERENDIPLLAMHFVEEANQEYNCSISGIDSTALRTLLDHSWPGNVRELRNVIRAALSTAKEKIQDKDLKIHGK